jgi:hypothetical protein
MTNSGYIVHYHCHIFGCMDLAIARLRLYGGPTDQVQCTGEASPWECTAPDPRRKSP